MPKYLIWTLSVLLLSIPTAALASGPFTEVTGFGNPLYFIPPSVWTNSAPAFADIDADGDLDFFITGGGSVSYYQNIGNNHIPNFIQLTDSANPLAEVDTSVALLSLALADVDADNDLDALIIGGSGLYFENTGTPQAPAFVERTGSANPLTAIYEPGYNSPALADMDADGDLDLFIGDFWSSIHYYENDGSPQTPHFTEQTGSANPLDGFGIDDIYYGPTAPALVDLEGDGDWDAFIGSQGGYVYYYENTGTPVNPVFVERTGSANPLDSIDPYLLDESRLAFVDLDGDGDFDCFVAQDEGGFGEDDRRLHFYENTGTAQDPTFINLAHPANPLGGFPGSAPALADLDGDGDRDAVVGAGGWEPFAEGGELTYYQNIGTVQQPAFTARRGSANPFNNIDIGDDSKPALVDINRDGDFDLFIGEEAGNVNFYENIGTAQQPNFVQRTGPANPLATVIVNYYSAPAFVDIDQDGDFDAFIGQNVTSNIKHYENTGTAQAPAFVERLDLDNPLDGVYDVQGSTPTFVDIDQDGDFDAFIGTMGGPVYHYENIGTPQNPILFPRGSASPLNADVGYSSAPTFADLDGDGDADALIGASSGKIYYYRNGAASGGNNKTYLPLVLKLR